jgi:hypothetical protein
MYIVYFFCGTGRFFCCDFWDWCCCLVCFVFCFVVYFGFDDLVVVGV